MRLYSVKTERHGAPRCTSSRASKAHWDYFTGLASMSKPVFLYMWFSTDESVQWLNPVGRECD